MTHLHLVCYVVASVMFAIAAYPPPGHLRFEWLGALALSLTFWV